MRILLLYVNNIGIGFNLLGLFYLTHSIFFNTFYFNVTILFFLYVTR